MPTIEALEVLGKTSDSLKPYSPILLSIHYAKRHHLATFLPTDARSHRFLPISSRVSPRAHPCRPRESMPSRLSIHSHPLARSVSSTLA